MLGKLLLTMLALWSTAAFAAIEVNTATKAQLEAVQGVGAKLSARIVSERGKARFASWKDLIARVEGIGPSSAERLSKAGLTVNGATYSEPHVRHAPASAAPATTPSARLKQR